MGNTVDLVSAQYTNTIGAAQLATIWKDPDFETGEPAFYYVRALQIPTPRWVLYDRARHDGITLPDGATLVHQERVYSSPIWYEPRSGAACGRDA